MFARVPKVILDECDNMRTARHKHMDPKLVWFYWSQNLARHVSNHWSVSTLKKVTFLNTLPVLDSWQLMEYTTLVRDDLLDFESELPNIELENLQGEVMNVTSIIYPNHLVALRACVSAFYHVMEWLLPAARELSAETFLGLSTPPKTVRQITVTIADSRINGIKITEDFDMDNFKEELSFSRGKDRERA